MSASRRDVQVVLSVISPPSQRDLRRWTRWSIGGCVRPAVPSLLQPAERASHDERTVQMTEGEQQDQGSEAEPQATTEQTPVAPTPATPVVVPSHTHDDAKASQLSSGTKFAAG